MPIPVHYMPLVETVLDFPWDIATDIVLSIEKYLKGQQYERNDDQGTIFDHFRDTERLEGQQDLKWRIGFPDDISDIARKIPLLAINNPVLDETEWVTAAGSRYNVEPVPMTISGYAGAETATSRFKNNDKQMIRLMGDLRNLLRYGKSGGGTIEFYHFDDDGNVDTSLDPSSLRITTVAATPLGAVGVTDAERFRFEVSFIAQPLTSIE